jgi:hypothetical protein
MYILCISSSVGLSWHFLIRLLPDNEQPDNGRCIRIMTADLVIAVISDFSRTPVLTAVPLLDGLGESAQ